MAGWVLTAKVIVVAVAIVAATLKCVVSGGGGGIHRVLTLERAFPVEERVELEVIKARDRARHARRLQSFSGGIVDLPVVGTSDPYVLGLYFTKVKLGSPPREFNVQIDTGSDLLWVTCGSCNNCPQNSGLGIPLNFFDAATSSTVSPISCSDNICASMARTASAECSAESNTCVYLFHYGDGSGTTGFYASDLLYFDTILGTSLVANSSAPIVFGCSTSLYGDLTKSDRAVDGIFGFGQQDLSVISQLSSRGITPKVFSHCLKGEGNGGGILVLGEILDPRIVYTPLVPSQSHYNLNLQSIAVNGQPLPIDQAVFTTSGNQGTIVDSGTTLAYLVEGAYDPLVAAISATVSPSVKPFISRGSQCYVVFTRFVFITHFLEILPGTKASWFKIYGELNKTVVVCSVTSLAETFPPVSFNFARGASLVLRPIDYLIQTGFADDAPTWCIGFLKVKSHETTILGDLVLKDKIFVYDLAHQRVGWADYDCSSQVNVSQTSSRDEFMNAGQLSVSGSSPSRVPFKMSNIALTFHIWIFIGCLFL